MKFHHLLLFVLLLLPISAHAQAGDPQVVLFHGTRDEISNVTLGGDLLIVSLNDASVQTIPLPPQLFPLNSIVRDVSISPDHRFLATVSYTISDYVPNPIMILDLQSNSCCITVQPPEPDIQLYNLGQFSPDSGRLAFSWTTGFEDGFPVGGVMTVDSATGTVLQTLSMNDVSAGLGLDFPSAIATLGDWRDDGIRLIDNCYACEPRFEGEWGIWTPETNTFSAHSGEYFSFSFGDVLPSTGEMLYTGQNAQFPVSTEPAYLPIPNVVYYIVDAPMPTFTGTTNAPVIFFDENQVDLSGYAHWVLDGHAVLVAPIMSNQWTLLFRDGTRQPVFVAPNSYPLVGTPNGWISLNDDPDGSVLNLYTIEGAEALATPLGITLGDRQYLQLLDAPELGASVTTRGGFPAVQPLFPSLSTSGSCPNLLPTRLTVNATARVTPGDPNRLRADPTTNGAIIGEIPGGAEFYVLQGPICDDANGITWWQVGYNNLVGWTAESQGSTYFTEPIGVG